MTVYLQDPDVTILQGDALELLKGMPSGSVHMACTSPPFYGLRDYGTGSWEGGQPDCDHLAPPRGGAQGGSLLSGLNAKRNPDGSLAADNHSHPEMGRTQYGQTCGKCGATRVDQQIGLEATPDEWVARLVDVFRELRRVLRDDGSLWLEIGDSYTAGKYGRTDQGRNIGGRGGNYSGGDFALGEQRSAPPGCKPKDLIGAPWLLAFALRADGWYLRSEIIWAKPNPMPESVSDRPTQSHSRVFLLTKSARYFYDAEAIREPHVSQEWYERYKDTVDAFGKRYGDGGNPNGGGNTGLATNRYSPGGRNRRSVWTIATQPYPEAHFATWPEKLVEPMILAGTSERGVCPECGAPWERIVERTERSSRDRIRNVGGREDGYTIATGRGEGFYTDTETTGWEPNCECDGRRSLDEPDHEPHPVPATILDPFGGSGTTALVARKHGRRAILLELSPDYCKLAAERLSMPTELVEDQAAAARALQLSLLAGEQA